MSDDLEKLRYSVLVLEDVTEHRTSEKKVRLFREQHFKMGPESPTP
jgi:hypothetical protein